MGTKDECESVKYKILWDWIKLQHTRRNTWNTLFLAINTLMLTAIVLGSEAKSTSIIEAKWLMIGASAVGGVICILWFLINRRLDADTKVRYAQINKMEPDDKDDDEEYVLLSRDTKPVFHGREPKKYLWNCQLDPSQTVPVRHLFLWLPVLFGFSYLLVGTYVFVEKVFEWQTRCSVFCESTAGILLLLTFWSVFLVLILWRASASTKKARENEEEDLQSTKTSLPPNT